MFEEINSVYDHSIEKIKSPYMVNRFLSFTSYMVLSIKMNKYIGRIPEWAIRAVYLANIKKRKGGAPYIPYQGRGKKTEKKLVEKVSQALCCSERHSKETIQLLRKLKYKPEQFFGLKKGE